jgi:transcriptional regulator with XRE-family HTH domain
MSLIPPTSAMAEPASLTGAQLRAARALLGISGEELAELTQLGLSTIRRAEADEGPVGLTRANRHIIVSVLQSMGIEFLNADATGGAGVRFATKSLRRRATDR